MYFVTGTYQYKKHVYLSGLSLFYMGFLWLVIKSVLKLDYSYAQSIYQQHNTIFKRIISNYIQFEKFQKTIRTKIINP